MPSLRDLKPALLHVAVYSVLLGAYVILVLRYLSGWLSDLFHHHRMDYAFAAILLMIGQAVGLEIISTLVIRVIKRGKR